MKGLSSPEQNFRIMYCSEDFERFYFQYQSEVLPHGESLQSFCVNQMIKSIIYLLKTGDSDRNREKDDYDGTNDTLRTDSVGYAQKDMRLCQHGS